VGEAGDEAEGCSTHTLNVQEAAQLAQALRANTHLTELYASGHELDQASVSAIASAVGANQTLRTLCLGNSTFGEEGTTELAQGIASSASLQQLDLESKCVGPEGAAAVCRALQAGLGLTTLLLARNPLGNTGLHIPGPSIVTSQFQIFRGLTVQTRGLGLMLFVITKRPTCRKQCTFFVAGQVAPGKPVGYLSSGGPAIWQTII